MSALRLRLVALLFFCAIGRATATATATVTVDDSFVERALGGDLELLLDASGKWTLEDVRGPALEQSWTRSTRQVPVFGYRKGAVWGRVHVDDRRSSPGPLVVELRYAVTDRIELHVVQGDGLVESFFSGDHVPRRDWPIDAREPAFVLKHPGLLYFRVSGGQSQQFPLVLQTQGAYEAHRRDDVAEQALFFGSLLAILAYNLLVWLLTRLRAYGLYVGYLSAYGLMQASLCGVGYELLWRTGGFWVDWSVPVLLDMSALLALAFADELLDLGRRRPRFRKVGFGIGAALALHLLTCWIFGYSLATRTVLVLVGIWAPYLICAGVLESLAGSRVGKLYLVAWSVFIVGVLLNVLRVVGVVPSTPVTTYSYQIGSVVEFILLSFVLADRIKALQGEVTLQAQRAHDAAEVAREATAQALLATEQTLEEHKRLGHLKDQFLANTSHELRTPLNGMIGMAESLLTQPTLDVLARPSVDAMVGAARRLSRLVTDILDFGALQGGNVSLNIRSLDLAPTVQAQVSHTMLQLAGRPLRIESYLSEGEFLIRADEARVAQVLAALLSNAVKFSERGLIELQARNDGDFVELAVRDQGIGIPEEQLANVTQAFEQGDGGAARRQGGTGLGLALAAKLIEAQQGTLTVRSTVGVGTTVVVRLPASREAATNFRIPVASVAPEALEAPVVAKENTHEVLRIPALPLLEDGVSGSMALRRLAVRPGVVSTMPPPRRLSAGVGARVLVVDDDDLNRRVIQEHLRNSPFTVVEASDGKSALRTFDSQGPFDAVLLDVMMPGMTGYEVCRALRRQVGPTDVPVLMLTAKQQVSDLVEGFDAGANDYVLKPFSKAELLARLSAHVGVARAALAMRRFVPRETIQLLGHDDLAAVCLGDAVEQRLSIAFSDVRGFTAAVERMTPAEAFRWLNRCYGIVAPEIRRAGGFVDKYIGDAIMALFPRAPADAVRAAVAMHRGLESMAGIRLGTGVHLGPTMLGTLGEPERFEATVLSDAVNVAARIEGATKAFGCRALVSKAVFQGLPDPDEWSWRALGKVQLKGRAASIELFELLDADAEEERELKLRYRDELEAGIDAFREDRLHEALLSFQHVAEENPLDGPALAYRLRTSQLLVSRGDFDGTFVLGEK